jgi:hypothetical protein
MIYNTLASECVAKMPLTSSRLGGLSICLSLKAEVHGLPAAVYEFTA